jgi:hypothetical protein
MKNVPLYLMDFNRMPHPLHGPGIFSENRLPGFLIPALLEKYMYQWHHKKENFCGNLFNKHSGMPAMSRVL